MPPVDYPQAHQRHPRPGMASYQPPRPEMPGADYPQAPPRHPLPGVHRQAPPPPSLSVPFADRYAEEQKRKAEEKRLEQAYLQSRADALNLKYHGGRPVLNTLSPEVHFSAAAPPAVHRIPSIPGTYGVVDAFKASEVKRQEWLNVKNQSPAQTRIPSPCPPGPSLPGPPSYAMPSTAPPAPGPMRF